MSKALTQFEEMEWSHEEGRYYTGGTIKLLAHARALEAMLRKHEWSAIVYGVAGCPNCMRQVHQGHLPDCQLAKLLE